MEIYEGACDENEMNSFYESDEMTAMNYQKHRLAPAPVLEPTTAKYLLDFIYFTRDDEQFRFYKKVSKSRKRQLRVMSFRGRITGSSSSMLFLTETAFHEFKPRSRVHELPHKFLSDHKSTENF